MRRGLVATLLISTLLLGASPGHGAEVPRLTGTLIGPGERTALFAAESGGTIPAIVGEHVGDYVVNDIEPGRVQLEKAGQHVVVSLKAAAAPAVRAPGIVVFGQVLRQQGPADN